MTSNIQTQLSSKVANNYVNPFFIHGDASSFPNGNSGWGWVLSNKGNQYGKASGDNYYISLDHSGSLITATQTSDQTTLQHKYTYLKIPIDGVRRSKLPGYLVMDSGNGLYAEYGGNDETIIAMTTSGDVVIGNNRYPRVEINGDIHLSHSINIGALLYLTTGWAYGSSYPAAYKVGQVFFKKA